MQSNARAPRRLLIPLAAALLVSAPAFSAAAAGPAPRTDADDALTGPACLLGTWGVDPGADGERILAVLDAVATDITVTTGEGDAVLSFTDDTITFALDGETVTEELTIGEHRYVGTWVTNGTLSARYTARAAYLDLDPAGLQNTIDLQRTWTQDGLATDWPQQVPFHTQGLSPFSGGMGYVCSGDELTFYYPEGGTLSEVFQRYVRLSGAPAGPSAPAPHGPAPQPPAPQGPATATPPTRGGAPTPATPPRAQAARPAAGTPSFTG